MTKTHKVKVVYYYTDTEYDRYDNLEDSKLIYIHEKTDWEEVSQEDFEFLVNNIKHIQAHLFVWIPESVPLAIKDIKKEIASIEKAKEEAKQKEEKKKREAEEKRKQKLVDRKKKQLEKLKKELQDN